MTEIGLAVTPGNHGAVLGMQNMPDFPEMTFWAIQIKAMQSLKSENV